MSIIIVGSRNTLAMPPTSWVPPGVLLPSCLKNLPLEEGGVQWVEVRRYVLSLSLLCHGCCIAAVVVVAMLPLSCHCHFFVVTIVSGV